MALDAAARGLRTALIDQSDFAAGTSSKSSKLIHGGLRYLQQGDVALVYEALHERQRLLRNAPHLVRMLPFMIPVMTRDASCRENCPRTRLGTVDVRPHRRLASGPAASPTARQGGARPHAHDERRKLSSAYLYFDAEADDARLTLSIVRSAIERNAVALNYCGVTSLNKDASGAIVGATVRTHEGESFEVRATWS